MIPVCEPSLGSAELHNVEQCLRTGWISGGKFVEDFERKWAAYCGMAHGIAVSNGTAALQLALQALNFPAGSEVIMPSFTIISCALAAIRNGLVPVFVDADPETWCIDPNLIEGAITPQTRAIMPVHIYGHPAEMNKIMNIAHRHKITVVEDAAQAHGAEIQMNSEHVRSDAESRTRRCGGIGHVSCFSFYGNKIVTTGEGGMILTNDSVVATKLRELRNLCFGVGDSRFIHTDLGHNYRMTNLQAAIGVAQVGRIEELLQKKRKVAFAYRYLLKHPKIQHPVEQPWVRSVYWMYGILVDNAQMVADHLRKRGVESRPFFVGLHQQPVLSAYVDKSRTYTVTERLSTHGLYLPSGVDLTDDVLQEVTSAILEIL